MARDYVTEASTRGANVSLLIVTSIIIGIRFLLSFSFSRAFQWDDIWLLAAYVFYITLSVIYLIFTPLLFRIKAVEVGGAPPYLELAADVSQLLRVVFPSTTLLWLVLWSIKFSLLAFYKQLTIRLRGFNQLWWVMVVACSLSLVGSVLSHIFACGTRVSNTFTPGGCESASSIYGIQISLWFAYAADVLTPVIMLPVLLILRVQMPVRQKISILSLVCLGLVCIAVATVRVIEVGRTFTDSTVPSVTWLALWAIVELSIAVIIGSIPGIYRTFRRRRQPKPGSYRLTDSSSRPDNRPVSKKVLATAPTLSFPTDYMIAVRDGSQEAVAETRPEDAHIRMTRSIRIRYDDDLDGPEPQI